MAEVATQTTIGDAQGLLLSMLDEVTPDYVLRHTSQPSTAQA